MGDRGLQGWTADPFGLHQERYFSAGHPTKLVRDGTIESFEEPPSDTFVPANAPAEAGAFGRATATAAAPSGSVATAPPPSRATSPRPPESGNAPPAGNAPPPGNALPPGYAPPPGYSWSSAREPRRPGRRRVILIVGVAAIAAATIAGVIVGQGKRSPATTTSPGQSLVLTSNAAFVTHAAQRTLGERTADLTMSGTVPFAGKKVAVDGTGELNFGTNSMAADMRMTTSSGSIEEKTVLVDGNFYYALTVDGTSFTKLVGRTWIQTPVQQSAQVSLAGSDPLSSLSVLEQQGSIIRPLGSKTIDGVNCVGYAVTPSRQAMVTETREQDAQQGVSASVTEQDVQQAQDTAPPTIMIWADGLGLAHELSIKLPINVQGASASGGDMDMDFTHFGAPVSITAPAPSDTISYPAFLKALGNKGA